MARHCIVCHRARAHEKFGGKGWRRVICRDCMQRPKAERLEVLWSDEICGFLEQKNISAKNIKRLLGLEKKGSREIAAIASVVRQIAQVHPRKKKRWGFLRFRHRQLYRQAVKLGLCEDFEPAQYYEPDDDLEGVWIESDPAAFSCDEALERYHDGNMPPDD